MAKILRLLANFALILLPFWPITENFFPPENQVNDKTFLIYILLCSGIIMVALGLVYIQKPVKNLAGRFLFAIGMTAIFALHLGPPRESAELLKFSSIEKFRYGMLLVAVLLFFTGSFKAANSIKNPTSKIFIIFLFVTTVLNIWDNFSSYMFSSKMQGWVDAGKKAEDFFTYFDYKMFWRCLARTLLYISAIWLSVMLFKRTEIKKWQLVILIAFCLIGIAFWVLFLLKGNQFYYPFMVPAIALAPSYWIGLMLMCNKTDLRMKSTS